MDNLRIVPFHIEYKSAFEKLNREWIEEYFVMEQEDLKTLQDPESYVIKKGGEIFFCNLGRKCGGHCSIDSNCWKCIWIGQDVRQEKSARKWDWKKIAEEMYWVFERKKSERNIFDNQWFPKACP